MVEDENLRAWDSSISKIIRLSDYQKLKGLLLSIDNQLESLSDVPEVTVKNVRGDMMKYHNKVKKVALEKQRERLVTKMKLLEDTIQKDIEELKL